MQKTIEKVTPLAIHESLSPWQRAAAYARVSSGKEAMLQSLSAQVSYYSEYIQQRNDWIYAGVYADEAMTGTKSARPEFQRMLEDCRAGKIDVIVTKSLSRLARNTVTLLSVLRELKELGIGVFFERENIWSNSGNGELLITILASYAQEESYSCSENCKWRIRKGFEQGVPYGLNFLYGYKIEKCALTIVPEEAEVVRGIFADYLAGMGVDAIHKKLRARGLMASRYFVYGVLRNEKFTGDLLLQKTFISDHLTKRKKVNQGQLPMYHVAGNHEAIIDKDTFARAQEEIARRAGSYPHATEPPPAYPFTGVIRCGVCGATYRRKINGAGTKYARPVWICNIYNIYGKNACGSQQIPESVLIEQSAAALGIPVFDASILTERVAEIQVPGANQLTFIFKDGHEANLAWQTSRRNSWTPEMRQKAREDSLRGHSKRGASSNEHNDPGTNRHGDPGKT
jgi:DNA invertase Pin-like site-specific DNA recombinase